MTVRSTDAGYTEMIQALSYLGEVTVTVGVHAEEGAATSKSGKTVAEIATINEFGLGVPARPAITSWADGKTNAIQILQEEIVKGIKARRKIGQSLDRVAQAWAGEIQGRISARAFKENAPSTIKKKKSSTPLVDSGQYRTAIRGRVTGDQEALNYTAPSGGGGRRGGGRRKGLKAKLKAVGKSLSKAGKRLRKAAKKASRKGDLLRRRTLKAGKRWTKKTIRQTRKVAKKAGKTVVRAARRTRRSVSRSLRRTRGR